MRWASYREAVLFQERVVSATGGSIGVLDQGKLEAALARPLTIVFDYEPFPTPALKVAALIESIITTHPFNDGNKRTAMRLGLALLEFNFPQVGVNEGRVTIPQVTQWLEGLYACADPAAVEFDPSDLRP